MRYVLVGGVAGRASRAIGPFDEADDARQYANDLALGIEELEWTVAPLLEP